MNIIILTSGGMATGGVRQALYLAQGMQAMEHKVHFACMPGEQKELALKMGLNWVDLPKKMAEADKVLRGLMPENESTVVHGFHNKGVKMAAYLGTLWRLEGRPVVCAAHRGVSARPHNPLPYLLPGIRSYMVNSHYCARILPLLWRRGRCQVVNNSIPAERIQPLRTTEEMRRELNIPNDRLILGNIVSDKIEKGAASLLRAYAAARPRLPASTLVLVGCQPDKLLPLCKELGIEEHCRLIGRTSHVADYIQLMSLLVFNSTFIESQPNVILEAMCMGVPVIAGNIGGIPEMLPGDCLFNPYAMPEISAKIVEMINAPERRQMLSQIGAAQRPLYSMENRLYVVASRYRAILAENAARKKPGPVAELIARAWRKFITR